VRYLRVLVLFLVAACASACVSSGGRPSPEPSEGEFSIRLLAEGIRADLLASTDLSSVVLEDEPTVSVSDMVGYGVQSHSIELTADAADRIRELVVPTVGLPFAVCVGNEPVYLGAFWSQLSSQSFDGVVIEIPLLCGQIIHLTLGYPGSSAFTGEDPRSDPKVLRSLEHSGMLR